ncbi:hypothetical protein GEMRC1_004472 [Eukaryota sp. GEM-RC1]
MPSSKSKSSNEDSSKSKDSKSKSRRSKDRSSKSSSERSSDKKDRKESKSRSSRSSSAPKEEPSSSKSIELPCQNCSKADSAMFCLECNQNLCTQCNDILHASSLSFHTRQPLNPNATQSSRCTLHPSSVLSHFCTGCDRCVCQECIQSICSSQPLHSAEPLSKAYTSRLLKLKADNDTRIRTKRKEIVREYDGISEVEQKVRERGHEIERSIKEFVQSITSRLQSHVDAVLAVPRQQKKELLKVLNILDRLDNFSNLDESKMVNFLNHFSDFSSELDFSIGFSSKFSDFDLNSTLDSIPNELSSLQSQPNLMIENRVYSDMCDHLLSTVEVKDQDHDMDFASINSELKNWIDLTDQYAKEISKLMLKCKHCGTVMSPNDANAVCPFNTDRKDPLRRHYWIKLKENQ